MCRSTFYPCPERLAAVDSATALGTVSYAIPSKFDSVAPALILVVLFLPGSRSASSGVLIATELGPS